MAPAVVRRDQPVQAPKVRGEGTRRLDAFKRIHLAPMRPRTDAGEHASRRPPHDAGENLLAQAGLLLLSRPSMMPPHDAGENAAFGTALPCDTLAATCEVCQSTLGACRYVCVAIALIVKELLWWRALLGLRATTEPLAAVGNAHTMIGAVSTGV